MEEKKASSLPDAVFGAPKDFAALFPAVIKAMPQFSAQTLPAGVTKSQFNRLTNAFMDPLHPEIERTIPRWKWLRRQNFQATCRHVIRMADCMVRFPGFGELGAEDRNLLMWYVFLHDLGKRGSKSKRKDPRDPFHPFGSAAAIVELLMFWFDTEKLSPEKHKILLTLKSAIETAFVWNKDWGIEFPDNSKLPTIFSLLRQVLPDDNMWSIMIRLTLLHQGVTVKPSAPAFSPLTDAEMRLYLTKGFLRYKTICDTCDEMSYKHLQPATWKAYIDMYSTAHAKIVARLGLC